MLTNNRNKGFTLLELLAVFAVIAIITALLLPALGAMRNQGNKTTCLNNMRQIGIAFLQYANDNNNQLPSRITGKNAAKWPTLLATYLQTSTVYAAPGLKNYLSVIPQPDPASSTANNTNFIMNGYNDLGAYNAPTPVVVKLNAIPLPSTTLLLGMEPLGGANFYMDFVEKNNTDPNVLILNAYDGGSNYIFADGSARWLKMPANLAAPQPGEYDQNMWNMNHSI